jgi:hypothetical protein
LTIDNDVPMEDEEFKSLREALISKYKLSHQNNVNVDEKEKIDNEQRNTN